MATRLVQFPLQSGGSVLVEEEFDDEAGELIARDPQPRLSKQTFEQVLTSLKPIADALANQVESLIARPEEVQVELGVVFRAEVGIIVAKSAADASLKISMKWKPERYVDLSTKDHA